MVQLLVAYIWAAAKVLTVMPVLWIFMHTTHRSVTRHDQLTGWFHNWCDHIQRSLTALEMKLEDRYL